MSKLRSETCKTMQLVPVHLDLSLFWKFHCATCSPVCVILYHVTGSCKGPISTAVRIKNNKNFGSNIRAIFYINYYYNFNPCGIFENMTIIIFSNSQARLGSRKINGGHKFAKINVQNPRALTFVTEIWQLISRKNLLCPKMKMDIELLNYFSLTVLQGMFRLN